MRGGANTWVDRDLVFRAVRSVSTFCTFLREFSPLEACAGLTKKVRLAGPRSLAVGFGPLFGSGTDTMSPFRFRLLHDFRCKHTRIGRLSWRSTRAARMSGRMLCG